MKQHLIFKVYLFLTTSKCMFKNVQEFVAQQVKNPTSIYEDEGLIPGLTQWVKGSGIAMSCDVGHRHGSETASLWPWYRPAAVADLTPSLGT